MRLSMDIHRQFTWLVVAAVLSVGGYYAYEYLSDAEHRQAISRWFGASEYRPMSREEAASFVVGTTVREDISRLYGTGRAPNRVGGLSCVRYPLRGSQTRSWRVCYDEADVLASKAIIDGQ